MKIVRIEIKEAKKRSKLMFCIRLIGLTEDGRETVEGILWSEINPVVSV